MGRSRRRRGLGKSSRNLMLLMFLLAASIVVGIQTGLIWGNLTGYSGGWQVYTSIVGFQYHDASGAIHTWKYGDSATFVDPCLGSPCQPAPDRMRVDVDPLNSGLPDISTVTGYVAHLNGAGEPSACEAGNCPVISTVQVQGYDKDGRPATFFYDQHAYRFSVHVRTFATLKKLCSDALGASSFDHETGAGHQDDGGLGCVGVPTPQDGLAFMGSIIIRFGIKIYGIQTYQPAPSGTVYDGQSGFWAGVMSGNFQNVQGGLEPTTDANGNPVAADAGTFYYKPQVDINSGVPMFYDDGTFARSYSTPTPTYNGTSLDSDIPSTVLIAVPIDLLAGAKRAWNCCGSVQDMIAIDTYNQFSIDMRMLTISGFRPLSGSFDPTLWIPADMISAAYGFWDSVGLALFGINPFNFLGDYAGFAAFLFTAIILLIILWIVLKALGIVGGGGKIKILTSALGQGVG